MRFKDSHFQARRCLERTPRQSKLGHSAEHMIPPLAAKHYDMLPEPYKWTITSSWRRNRSRRPHQVIKDYNCARHNLVGEQTESIGCTLVEVAINVQKAHRRVCSAICCLFLQKGGQALIEEALDEVHIVVHRREFAFKVKDPCLVVGVVISLPVLRETCKPQN